jgi:hypothetical protein
MMYLDNRSAMLSNSTNKYIFDDFQAAPYVYRYVEQKLLKYYYLCCGQTIAAHITI